MSASRKVTNKSLRSVPTNPAAADGDRILVQGNVAEVFDDDTVSFVVKGSRPLKCLCAVGVDLNWLRTALRLGPVRAEGSVPRAGGDEGTIWCLVPTPEQRRVLPEQINLVATQEVNIVCGKSNVKLAKNGTWRARGREVAIRGSRSTRIMGGVVRMN